MNKYRVAENNGIILETQNDTRKIARQVITSQPLTSIIVLWRLVDSEQRASLRTFQGP